MKFCSQCGNPVVLTVPAGDHLPRHVCERCGTIHYHNPKIITACIPEWEDGRILMCRRNIEPRLGKWTFPAGFLELHETSGAGAAREALEESLGAVEILDLMAVLNVPQVSQIYTVYRARLLKPEFGPTPESSEVRLMREEEIPWEEIAFPTIHHSLKFFFADRTAGVRGFHEMTIEHRRPAPKG